MVDAGYPNRPGYLAPYKGERYHMPEWHRGTEPRTPKEKFNRKHSSIRNVIERSFGLLKMKWQILYRMGNYPMWKQKMVVVACMVLHNFIREHNSEDADFARFDRDPNFMPTIPKRYKRFVFQQTHQIHLLRKPVPLVWILFGMKLPQHSLLGRTRL